MSIRIGWFFVFLFFAVSARGQNIPGSVYSVFGFGDIRDRSSAFTRALGNTGIAVRDDYNINIVNPAALTSVIRPLTSLFEIGTNYGRTDFNTSNASYSARYGSLVGLNYWFRLGNKWASTVGVAPYSNVSYNILSSRVFGAGYLPSPIQYQGTGGINQFYLGNAYDILKNLTIGGNVSFYLGTEKKANVVAATGVSSLFEVDEILQTRGANFDLGLQYSLSIKKTKLIFGVTWDKGACLTGTQEIAIVNPITFDTLRKTDRLVLPTRLPPNMGFGLGLKANRSTFAADIKYINWKKAEWDEVEQYRNGFKYSAGYDYRGEFGTYNYLKSISFRAGAWVEDYPIAVRNTYLTTWGYTIGIALPIQGPRATVGLNYSVTRLGTTKSDLVQEISRKLSLDIIVRDVWGVKQKFD